MNLPNAITVARIAATPLIAWLPLVESWPARLLAFVLFVVAAVTDWVDGHLARTRQSETDLGRLLDPLADKLLLVATFVPMFVLSAPRDDLFAGAIAGAPSAFEFPYLTPVGMLPLPWWVLAVVLGRELFMTLFRQAAARRGTIIAAIGPAKWKTGFQSTWVGAAFFWYFNATLAHEKGWLEAPWWRAFAHFNGLVVLVTMVVAVVLTVYSLWLYLRRYGGALKGGSRPSAVGHRPKQ